MAPKTAGIPRQAGRQSYRAFVCAEFLGEREFGACPRIAGRRAATEPTTVARSRAAVEPVVEARAQVADPAADVALPLAELRHFPLFPRLVTVVRTDTRPRPGIGGKKRRERSCAGQRQEQTTRYQMNPAHRCSPSSVWQTTIASCPYCVFRQAISRHSGPKSGTRRALTGVERRPTVAARRCGLGRRATGLASRHAGHQRRRQLPRPLQVQPVGGLAAVPGPRGQYGAGCAARRAVNRMQAARVAIEANRAVTQDPVNS